MTSTVRTLRSAAAAGVSSDILIPKGTNFDGTHCRLAVLFDGNGSLQSFNTTSNSARTWALSYDSTNDKLENNTMTFAADSAPSLASVNTGSNAILSIMAFKTTGGIALNNTSLAAWGGIFSDDISDCLGSSGLGGAVLGGGVFGSMAGAEVLSESLSGLSGINNATVVTASLENAGAHYTHVWIRSAATPEGSELVDQVGSGLATRATIANQATIYLEASANAEIYGFGLFTYPNAVIPSNWKDLAVTTGLNWCTATPGKKGIASDLLYRW